MCVCICMSMCVYMSGHVCGSQRTTSFVDSCLFAWDDLSLLHRANQLYFPFLAILVTIRLRYYRYVLMWLTFHGFSGCQLRSLLLNGKAFAQWAISSTIFTSFICLKINFVCDMILVSQILVFFKKYSLEWVENVELREFFFPKIFYPSASWIRKTLDSGFILSFIWIILLWTLSCLASSHNLY